MRGLERVFRLCWIRIWFFRRLDPHSVLLERQTRIMYCYGSDTDPVNFNRICDPTVDSRRLLRLCYTTGSDIFLGVGSGSETRYFTPESSQSEIRPPQTQERTLNPFHSNMHSAIIRRGIYRIMGWSGFWIFLRMGPIFSFLMVEPGIYIKGWIRSNPKIWL